MLKYKVKVEFEIEAIAENEKEAQHIFWNHFDELLREEGYEMKIDKVEE